MKTDVHIGDVSYHRSEHQQQPYYMTKRVHND